ncbi:MAG: enoyl-CoA hydratase-related protein [Dehalococcoidia bacterium]
MAPGIHVKTDEGIAFITLEGRGDLNLLGREVFGALAEGLEQVANNSHVSAVILRGSGKRAFSAGVDLHEMKDLAPLDAETFIRTLHNTIQCIFTLELPVIAAIQGPCLGGALEMALACDLRVAAEDALFGLPEVRVGIPSVIQASLLPRTVGLGRARAMLLTGKTISADEAFRIGLVDQVVPPDQLEKVALEVARGFLGMSSRVLSVQKDIIAKWLELGEEEAAEYSIKAFALCFATHDPREAMTAYLEKREAHF